MRVYSTCPQSKDIPRADFRRRVEEVSRWSEAQGCEGMLIYTDNGLVDPWQVAQVVLGATRTLAPLVALQPVYMHPYTAAKMVTTLGYLFGRRVDINLLAGGFRNDLLALGDDTAHDDRYARAVEYAQVMMALLRGEAPVTVSGRWVQVDRLRLAPELPAALLPALLLSGSSAAGQDAARTLGATAIRYPQDPGLEDAIPRLDGLATGLRVGIIARDDREAAWAEARRRFPEDRRGQLLHELAMRTSDSQWHHALSGDAATHGGAADADALPSSPFWLHPFRQYGTFCPYLVGGYDEVARELARYVAAGDGVLITDIPREEADLVHVNRVLAQVHALEAAA